MAVTLVAWSCGGTQNSEQEEEEEKKRRRRKTASFGLIFPHIRGLSGNMKHSLFSPLLGW
jgi:hypothetical protein